MNLKNIRTESVDHLGLVSGMINDIGLIQILDDLLPSQKHVSHGQAVAAMILNGLGYANKRLYLTPLFFSKKSVKNLIGSNITSDMINGDTLSRTLDSVYEYGVTDLFQIISEKTLSHLGLNSHYSHLDSTTFHVDGNNYKSDDPKVVKIIPGYSKDHRPDLNQIVLNLIVENRSGIPYYLSVASGNKNDKKGFNEIINHHLSSFKGSFSDSILIADSALYTQETIQLLFQEKHKFITRVPGTIKEAKQLIKSADNLKKI